MCPRPRGRPLPWCLPLTRPLPALPAGTPLHAHFALITILCRETMGSAAPCLHNRLNPAEVQVPPKGTRERPAPSLSSRPGAGAAERGPPRGCSPSRALSPPGPAAGTLLTPPQNELLRGTASRVHQRAGSIPAEVAVESRPPGSHLENAPGQAPQTALLLPAGLSRKRHVQASPALMWSCSWDIHRQCRIVCHHIGNVIVVFKLLHLRD